MLMRKSPSSASLASLVAPSSFDSPPSLAGSPSPRSLSCSFLPPLSSSAQITDRRVIQHRRIRHKPGHGYLLDEERFDSLEGLVRAQVLLSPPSSSILTPSQGLSLACDGSRFLHLFEQNKPQVQGYISADY